jgi:Cupredoxin-like domain
MTGSRASRLVLVAALAAAIGGCAQAQGVAGDRSLRIAITEYRLRPDNIRVHSGYLDISVRNYGRLTHNLVISSNGVSAGSTKPIWPGQHAEMTVSLPPGKYSIASTMLSDQALGTYGTLTVTR